MAVQKFSQIAAAGSPPLATDTVIGVGGGTTDFQYTLSQVGTSLGANPTATASNVAVNGVATTFMRSDAAPAIQLTSSSVFGVCKVDGSTVTASGGVISSTGGSGTITVNTTPISGGTTGHVAYDNAGTFGEAANFTISSGNPNVTTGNAYLYNGVNAVRALTAVGAGNWYLANSGNLSTTATDDVAIGPGALGAINAGIAGAGQNVAIGTNALNTATVAMGNVFVGNSAGLSFTGSTIQNCVGIGFNSMALATGGNGNVGMGLHTLNNNTTGTFNSALGASALKANTTGTGNSADGNGALAANTTGNNNFAMGSGSLTTNIDGSSNVGLGFQSLNAADHANGNTAVGNATMDSLVGSGSSNNTAIGNACGRGLASGSDANNVFIGFHAGNNITAGSGNVVIGSAILGPTGTANNTISIGTGDGTLHLDYAATNAGKWTFANSPVMPNFTVATLPTGVTGAVAYVTDGDANLAWGATATNSGAGATKYMVWYNGTNWTVMGK